ncbi:unnamed protein product [Spirodela intermedia]|uniref:DNA-(apurinic or apyrimidinic site) lyase n=1 Tax=Spirodela intermedia TaxID=51605 RepID=A0A7I8J137_SPIIN|nr:unnamed protein product [Spirodela intermedia]CAA6663847.1 unnamed protein product [Spirodela intermedia]
MWRSFASADARFAELDPVECLFQFLCSSNNNIARIERMVAAVSAFGEHLGTVEGVDFHHFPSIDRLAEVSEEQLRKAGFGYRSVIFCLSFSRCPASEARGRRGVAPFPARLGAHAVTEALCTLPGVGPKVAACVALFSLDQHHAIPVDTHVWQGLGAFVDRFGRYAGWAQTALFVGELPPQKALLPPPPANLKKATKPRKEKLREDGGRNLRPLREAGESFWADLAAHFCLL